MYVAQCLEYDISTQAPTLEALLDRLDLTVEAECQMSLERGGNQPFDGICPAPNYFHSLWDKGSMAIKRLNHKVDGHFPSLDVKIAAA